MHYLIQALSGLVGIALGLWGISNGRIERFELWTAKHIFKESYLQDHDDK